MAVALLSNQNFRRYMAGTTVSIIGSSLTDSIWPILTYWITESPLLTGLTVAAQVVPHMIFGLISGAQVDRAKSRRPFLIYPNLISALAFFVCTGFGADSVHALAVALFCYLSLNVRPSTTPAQFQRFCPECWKSNNLRARVQPSR